MAIDVSQFETIEELDKVYRRRINQATEEDEPEVKNEYLEASALFWKAQAGRAALDKAKVEALDKFPFAKQFPDLVSGNSPEEITNSAKRVHERWEQGLKDAAVAQTASAAATDAERQEAAAAYGAPAGGGGGAEAQQSIPREEELKKTVRTRLEAGDAPTRMQASQFSAVRFREAVEQAQGPNPSFRRPADRKVQDDRARR